MLSSRTETDGTTAPVTLHLCPIPGTAEVEIILRSSKEEIIRSRQQEKIIHSNCGCGADDGPNATTHQLSFVEQPRSKPFKLWEQYIGEDIHMALSNNKFVEEKGGADDGSIAKTQELTNMEPSCDVGVDTLARHNN